MPITMQNHNDPAYEALFNELMEQTFGFSFAPWHALGLWDEQYESYSIIEGGVMLANICVFKRELLIYGRPQLTLQLGAVATRKAHRGQGLSRRIMEHILAKYPCMPAVLSANENVTEFYPRFGFRLAVDMCPTMAYAIHNHHIAPEKRAFTDQIVRESVWNRRNYSRVFDSINAPSVRMFHLLFDYADDIYAIPEYSAIVVANQTEDKLFIADVMSEGELAWADLAKALPFAGVRKVEFGFCPDRLGVVPDWSPLDGHKDPYFIRGDWEMPENARFPVMDFT